MPTLITSKLPVPKSWDEFEDITLSASKLRWGHPNFFRHGRSGQQQHGVDIFGEDEVHRPIGIQCKNTIAAISENVLLAEIKNAESFHPPLSALYIATSVDHDSKLQGRARIISSERVSQNKFPVHVLFWKDITGDLAKDEEEFIKYFGNFFVQTAQPQTHPANGNPTFTIDEMEIVRHPAFAGKSIPRKNILKWSTVVASLGALGLMLTFSKVLGPNSGNWTPLAMLLCMSGLVLAIISEVLSKRKFEYFLRGKYYLEASTSDRIHLNSLTATCPWCASKMHLRHIGPKNGVKDDIFICERNPRQHTILLDPTVLPEIKD
ncbi:hypothetical protein [Pseudoduganella lutea]|uniref:hypothetical protein n=1 Tax=Pseudoduganella lutea TaxID=321985 RepID=UPI001A90D168|nr:hypothetical protein [Pseudoduganella lutea]